MTLDVLHLVGSPTSEFYLDLSVHYARGCLAATADPTRYRARIAYVTPDRRWRFPTDLSSATIAAAPSMSLGAAIRRLSDLSLDLMVPQMFCGSGMTTYRGLFDLLEIPYVGNTPVTMALAANKAQAKAVVAAAGVPVPAGEVLYPGQQTSIAPPAVVKPVDTDNSLGVTLVREPADYPAALSAARTHSEQVLVETFIPLGREVRCGILERDGQLIGLPLEEYRMDSVDKPVRLLGDKIDHDETGEVYLVAKDSSRSWIVDPADPVNEKVWALAKACHVALGCRHYSLFDFRIDPDGQPWFLEAGPYCSFAEQSVVAVMARAAGIGIESLFQTAVEQALGSAHLRHVS